MKSVSIKKNFPKLIIEVQLKGLPRGDCSQFKGKGNLDNSQQQDNSLIALDETVTGLRLSNELCRCGPPRSLNPTFSVLYLTMYSDASKDKSENVYLGTVGTQYYRSLE